MNPVALREILKEIKDRHSLGDYVGIMESDSAYSFTYYFDKNLKEFATGADVLITHWMPLPKGPEEK